MKDKQKQLFNLVSKFDGYVYVCPSRNTDCFNILFHKISITINIFHIRCIKCQTEFGLTPGTILKPVHINYIEIIV